MDHCPDQGPPTFRRRRASVADLHVFTSEPNTMSLRDLASRWHD